MGSEKGRSMYMAKFPDRLLSRSANMATFWPLVPSGIIGVLAGIFSRGVAAINAYGPFGWLMAGLVAFALSSVAIYLAALAFDRFSAALAKRKWARDVDTVNPLDPEFNRKSIRLLDLVHPVTSRIAKKRFVECRLLGPANLVLVGGMMNGTGFLNCDFVIHTKPVFIQNAVVLEEVQILGGEFIRCTIYVDQEAYDASIAPMGNANLVSYQRPPDEKGGQANA
jgi:hypothetical protein